MFSKYSFCPKQTLLGFFSLRRSRDESYARTKTCCGRRRGRGTRRRDAWRRGRRHEPRRRWCRHLRRRCQHRRRRRCRQITSCLRDSEKTPTSKKPIFGVNLRYSAASRSICQLFWSPGREQKTIASYQAWNWLWLLALSTFWGTNLQAHKMTPKKNWWNCPIVCNTMLSCLLGFISNPVSCLWFNPGSNLIYAIV